MMTVVMLTILGAVLLILVILGGSVLIDAIRYREVYDEYNDGP